MSKVLLNLAKVSINLGGKQIFNEVELELQNNQRVGLVGANGAGKSTLMKLMSQELTADSGEIFRASGLTFGRLEQEPRMDTGRTVLQEALTAVPHFAEIEDALRAIDLKMENPAVYNDYAKLEKVLNKQATLLEEFEQLGGSRYESNVKSALDALGMGNAHWDKPTHVLSGGQKKLILLAKLLVAQPQLLLLDEPDNHLDVPAKRKLEKIINHYNGCVLIISHDRYLLDEICTHVAELENGKLNLFHGNYTTYTNERELRRLRQQQLYIAQQKEIAKIEAAIARFELWASIVVDERHIKQARSRRKMLDKMDKVEKVHDQRAMQLNMKGWQGSKKVLEFDDVGKILPNGVTLWDGIDFTLWHGSRIGLVGPNGAGKSMMFRHILAPENLDQGQIKVGPSIKIGYYAQEHETLGNAESPLEIIRNTLPISESDAVAYLGRFLFTYDQIRGNINTLSGGERSRLQLAQLVIQRPNLLLLDEPTNNLDIASIEVLEGALEEFVGTVFVISHDRFFLDQVVDQIIELRDGGISFFDGAYTDYLEVVGEG